MKIAEQERFDDLHIQCNRLKSERNTLKAERDGVLVDYRALERRYTDLNALWAARGREIAALRAELTELADVAKRVIHTFEEDLDPQPMTDSQHFALKALSVSVGLARRTLGGN